MVVFQAQIEINIPILIYYLPEPKQLFQNLSALWKYSYINSVCWENYLHTKNQLVVDRISFNIFLSRLSKSWLRIYASCCLSVALLIPSPNNLILFSYSGYSGGWLTIIDIINAFKIITLKALFSLLICIWKLTKYSVRMYCLERLPCCNYLIIGIYIDMIYSSTQLATFVCLSSWSCFN